MIEHLPHPHDIVYIFLWINNHEFAHWLGRLIRSEVNAWLLRPFELDLSGRDRVCEFKDGSRSTRVETIDLLLQSWNELSQRHHLKEALDLIDYLQENIIAGLLGDQCQPAHAILDAIRDGVFRRMNELRGATLPESVDDVSVLYSSPGTDSK
jgi:hypothetical protein